MEKMTWQEFAQSIKRKYPDYAEVDDKDLAERMLAKFPDYQEAVDTTGIGGGSMEMPADTAKPLALQSPAEIAAKQQAAPAPSDISLVEALFPRRVAQERNAPAPDDILANIKFGASMVPAAAGDALSLIGRAMSASVEAPQSKKSFKELLAYGSGRDGLMSLPEQITRDPATPVSMFFGGPLTQALKGLPTALRLPTMGASEGVMTTATSKVLTPQKEEYTGQNIVDLGIGGAMGAGTGAIGGSLPIVAKKLKELPERMEDIKAQKQAIKDIKTLREVPDQYGGTPIQDKDAAAIYNDLGVMQYYPEVTGLPQPVELRATAQKAQKKVVDPEMQETDFALDDEAPTTEFVQKAFPDQDELRQVALQKKGDENLPDIPEYVWQKYALPAFREYRAQRQQIGAQKGAVEKELMAALPEIPKKEIYRVMNDALKPAGVSVSFRIGSDGKVSPVFKNTAGTEMPAGFVSPQVKEMLSKVASLESKVPADLVLSLRSQIDEMLPEPKVSAFEKDTPQTAAIKKMKDGLIARVYKEIDDLNDPIYDEMKKQHQELRKEYAKRVETEKNLGRLIGKQIDESGATTKGEASLKRIHGSLSNQGADVLWKKISDATGIDVNNAAAQMRVAMLEAGDQRIEDLNELVKLARDAQSGQMPLSGVTMSGAALAGGKAAVDAAKKKIAPKGGESARVLQKLRRDEKLKGGLKQPKQVVPLSTFSEQEIQDIFARAMGSASAQRSKERSK